MIRHSVLGFGALGMGPQDLVLLLVLLGRAVFSTSGLAGFGTRDGERGLHVGPCGSHDPGVSASVVVMPRSSGAGTCGTLAAWVGIGWPRWAWVWHERDCALVLGLSAVLFGPNWGSHGAGFGACGMVPDFGAGMLTSSGLRLVWN
jgi:hypothetical protein